MLILIDYDNDIDNTIVKQITNKICETYDCNFFDIKKISENIKDIQSLKFITLKKILDSDFSEIGKNVVYLGDNPCVAGGDIIVMKHNEEPRFMNYVLNADCSQKQKSKGKAKLKVVHISATAIGDVMVSLPDKDTQINIANYLDEKCRIIDKLTNKKKIKIDKLNQYKKSLIYEYVTGKKRVLLYD